MELLTVASLLLAVTAIVQCGEANEKKSETQGIFSSNIGNSVRGQYENFYTQDLGNSKNNEGFSGAQEGFGQKLGNNYGGSFNNGNGGVGKSFGDGTVKYENYNNQNLGSLKNNLQREFGQNLVSNYQGSFNGVGGTNFGSGAGNRATDQREFGQSLVGNYQGSFNGVGGTSFGSGAGNRATVSTVTQTVGVLVPQPYRVIVNRPVPVRVPQPFAVYVPRAVQVPLPVPRPVLVPRLVPFVVSRAVPVPVRVPVQVPVPQPVGVIVPQPYTVTIPRPYTVKVPQNFVIPVAQPVIVGNGPAGAGGARNAGLGSDFKNVYSTGILNGFGNNENNGYRNEVENNSFGKGGVRYTLVSQSYPAKASQKFVISLPENVGNRATGAYEVRGANLGGGYGNGYGAAIGNVVGKESENNARTSQKFLISVPEHVFTGNEAAGGYEVRGTNLGGGYGAAIANIVGNNGFGQGTANGQLTVQNIRGRFENVKQGLSLGNALYYKGTSSLEGGQSYRDDSSAGSGQSFSSNNIFSNGNKNEISSNVNDLSENGYSSGRVLSYEGTSPSGQEQKNSLNGVLSYKGYSSLGSGQSFVSSSTSSNEDKNGFSSNVNGFALKNEEEQRNELNGNLVYQGENSLGSAQSFVSSGTSSNEDKNDLSSSLGGKNEEPSQSGYYYGVGQRSASSYSNVPNKESDK